MHPIVGILLKYFLVEHTILDGPFTVTASHTQEQYLHDYKTSTLEQEQF